MFFQSRIKLLIFLKDMGCFEHMYPDLYLLLGIYTASVDLDGQISAITGPPKPE